MTPALESTPQMLPLATHQGRGGMAELVAKGFHRDFSF
jgi:hypothetical protein